MFSLKDLLRRRRKPSPSEKQYTRVFEHKKPTPLPGKAGQGRLGGWNESFAHAASSAAGQLCQIFGYRLPGFENSASAYD